MSATSLTALPWELELVFCFYNTPEADKENVSSAFVVLEAKNSSPWHQLCREPSKLYHFRMAPWWNHRHYIARYCWQVHRAQQELENCADQTWSVRISLSQEQHQSAPVTQSLFATPHFLTVPHYLLASPLYGQTPSTGILGGHTQTIRTWVSHSCSSMRSLLGN